MIGRFPLIIRPAFTLGGTGGGIAYNMDEFVEIVNAGITASLTDQVLALALCIPKLIPSHHLYSYLLSFFVIHLVSLNSFLHIICIFICYFLL
jgi:hypothetical protein